MKQVISDSGFVKWFSELNKNSGPVAGGKGANLAEIYNLHVQVPPGFVVTAQAYNYFIKRAGLDSRIKTLLQSIDYENTAQLDRVTGEIREMIVSAQMAPEMKEEIIESYDSLGSGSDHGSTADKLLEKPSHQISVAVRSSATAEDLAEASFAGQQETFLNVIGHENLLTAVKKCFASLFTPRATYYRNKKGFKHEQVSLAVVVQKMVDSDKSGVVFTKDPSQRRNYVIIEAVFGLGEGIVSGQITPDHYVVSREGLKILEKEIKEKKIALVRSPGSGHEKVVLKEEISKKQVLKDHEIIHLAEMCLKLEEHYKKPQDIEFAVEGDKIYIVQTRPITTLEKRFLESEIKDLNGEVILTGLAASPGIGVGKVKIVHTMADLEKVTAGDILVTEMTNPDMVVTMQRCSAIITDEGGLTAHAAIVSREMGIPAVVGTREATKTFKDGELVTVDGFNGKIYRGKVAESERKEIKPIKHQTKTKLKIILDLPTVAPRAAKAGITSIGLARLEGIIAESGKHPNYFLEKERMKDYEELIFRGISKIAEHFDDIWVRTSDIRTDEFQNLQGAPSKVEANPMLGMHGIRFSLKNPEILRAELKALKHVAANGKTKIGIMAPQIISVTEIRDLKKAIKDLGFHEAKVGVMVETPAAVQIIQEICQEGIAFISFGTNDLTQYTLAIDRGNEQVQSLYDEMHPSILSQISHVIKVCKEHGVESSICGQAGSNEAMVRFLVAEKIDSISVNADVAADIAQHIFELEATNSKSHDHGSHETDSISRAEPVVVEHLKYSATEHGHTVTPMLAEDIIEFPKIPGAEYAEKNPIDRVEEDTISTVF